MGSDTETEILINCMNVIIWNRRFLRTVGVWPLKVFDPIFIFSFVYLFIHVTSAFMDIANYNKDVEMIIANTSESLLVLSILIKITLCRLHRNSLSKFLIDIQDDFKIQNYRSRNEILSFFRYNRLSFMFIALAVPTTIITTTIYYFRQLATNVRLVLANSSFGYQLPYKTQPIIPIHDDYTYGCYCLFQILIVPYVSFGFVGYDSFFVTLSLHVSGQLSVINQRVKDALNEPHNREHGMKSLIISHRRLIRLADTLEENFTIGILQHLLITMWNISMSGYNALKGTNSGQSMQLVIFILFLIPVLSTLFIYCYIGECLTQESVQFEEAFYDSEWYNMSPSDLKLVFICMLRSSRPLHLTSGKFFILSLSTFTDIIKSTMGYLSVMRTFVN